MKSLLTLWLAVVATALLGVIALEAADAPPGPPPTSAPSKIRALIVTGVDYPGHPWPQTTPVLRKQLEQDKRFIVRVVEDPHLLDSAALKSYDVVILHFMNWEVPAPDARARQNLSEFVAAGKGLVLVHFACGAWQDWPGFEALAGRVWDPKLRGHDPRGVFTVVPTAVEHPITQGLAAFETDDELYTCLAGQTPVQVLATARSKVDARDYPMAFVLNYGQGRVFHSPLGHDAKALDSAAVGELFRRGAAWAAGHAPVMR
jgi:type 1 glutamine amidotransferase